MLLLDELRLELEGYRKDMKELYVILNIDKLKEENAELQESWIRYSPDADLHV